MRSEASPPPYTLTLRRRMLAQRSGSSARTCCSATAPGETHYYTRHTTGPGSSHTHRYLATKRQPRTVIVRTFFRRFSNSYSHFFAVQTHQIRFTAGSQPHLSAGLPQELTRPQSTGTHGHASLLSDTAYTYGAVYPCPITVAQAPNTAVANTTDNCSALSATQFKALSMLSRQQSNSRYTYLPVTCCQRNAHRSKAHT